jgi:hypothetical protein
VTTERESVSDINPKVVALVERELKKDPDLRSTKLRQKAAKIDRSVGTMTGRQFHAKYVLQSRRKLFGGKRSATRRASKSSGRKDADPARALLADAVAAEKVALNEAIDRAYEGAFRADSVEGISRLLSAIQRCRKDCEVL